MNRQLTKRVLFEKKTNKNYDYNFDLEFVKNNVSHFFSDVEMLSIQNSFDPRNFEHRNIILLGLTLNNDIFHLNYLLDEEKHKIFLEELQDDFSVKVWDKLTSLIVKRKVEEEKIYIKENLVSTFFIFLVDNKNEEDYSFLDATQDITSLVHLKLNYRFMGSNLDMSKTEHLNQVFSGIFNELYFKFYKKCESKNYKVTLYSIGSIKLYTDKYVSDYSFTVSFCVKDLNSNIIDGLNFML